MDTRIILRALVSITLAGALALPGQQGAFQTPSSGYVFDPYAQAVRPVIGYVGSAYLGSAVVRAEWASISPDSQSAWIWKDGRLLFLPSLTEDAPLEWSGLGQPELAFWSKDGRKSLLVAQGSLAVVARSQNGELQAEGEFKAPEGSSLRLLAASSDLAIAAVAVRADEAAPWDLLLWQVGREAQRLGSIAEPTAAVFDGARGVYIADSGNKNVVRFALDASTDPEVILSADQGIDSPCALLTVSGSLIVVEREARAVRRYSLESRELDREEFLDEAPGLVASLGNNRFLLNQRTRKQQAVLILDLTGDPKVSFVPAGE